MGQTWTLSQAHPQHIAENAVFAVSFLSGLPAELLAYGVPTIERRLTTSPSPSSERSLGLVLGADSEEEFMVAAGRLLSGGREVVEGLRASWLRGYSDPRGSVETIVRELEAAVKEQRYCAVRSGTLGADRLRLRTMGGSGLRAHPPRGYTRGGSWKVSPSVPGVRSGA